MDDPATIVILGKCITLKRKLMVCTILLCTAIPQIVKAAHLHHQTRLKTYRCATTISVAPEKIIGNRRNQDLIG